MAKIFVAVASDTPNDKMIFNMAKKPIVMEMQCLPGTSIDVEGFNFYCIDYGEKMKLDTVRKIAQALQFHKKMFNDKGTIYRLMLAGNNVTMDRFLEEVIEEVEDEVEDNAEDSEEKEEECDDMAVSDTNSEEPDGINSGLS